MLPLLSWFTLTMQLVLCIEYVFEYSFIYENYGIYCARIHGPSYNIDYNNLVSL